MNSTIELIVELIVGVGFLFAAGHALSRVIGSDEYYDKILYDDDDDFITKKIMMLAMIIVILSITYQFKNKKYNQNININLNGSNNISEYPEWLHYWNL